MMKTFGHKIEFVRIVSSFYNDPVKCVRLFSVELVDSSWNGFNIDDGRESNEILYGDCPLVRDRRGKILKPPSDARLGEGFSSVFFDTDTP